MSNIETLNTGLNKKLTRREFLKRTAQAGGAVLLAASVPGIFTACETLEDHLQKTEPKTNAEKEIYETLQVFAKIDQDWEVKDSNTAVLLTTGALFQNEEPSVILTQYNDALKIIDRPDTAAATANLLVASRLNGYSFEDTHNLYKEAKKRLKAQREEEQADEIVNLAIVNKGDLDGVLDLKSKIFPKDRGIFFFNPEYRLPLILASLINKDVGATMKLFEETAENSRGYSGPSVVHTRLSLALAATINNNNLDRVMEDYSAITKKDGTVGAYKYTDRANNLTLAATFNGHNIPKIAEMDQFARRELQWTRGADSDGTLSSQLVLLTAQKNNKLPITSVDEAVSAANVAGLTPAQFWWFTAAGAVASGIFNPPVRR